MSKNYTKFVGIVNVTPDSFSDGGLYSSAEAAFMRANELIKNGADVIDIGAESTRPDAKSLSHEEEWQRLLPILKLVKNLPVTISVDTYHSKTAEKAMSRGVNWINDVSGFSSNEMIDAVRDSDVTLVVMHNLGIPTDTEKTLPENCNAVDEVYKWGEEKISYLEKSGIDNSRIIFDPGIGFGKTAEQSLLLIKNISVFKSLGVPLFVGHSEKSFLKLFTEKPAGERNIETFMTSVYLASKNVDYIRVHDVAGNKRAVNIFEKLYI